MTMTDPALTEPPMDPTAPPEPEAPEQDEEPEYRTLSEYRDWAAKSQRAMESAQMRTLVLGGPLPAGADEAREAKGRLAEVETYADRAAQAISNGARADELRSFLIEEKSFMPDEEFGALVNDRLRGTEWARQRGDQALVYDRIFLSPEQRAIKAIESMPALEASWTDFDWSQAVPFYGTIESVRSDIELVETLDRINKSPSPAQEDILRVEKWLVETYRPRTTGRKVQEGLAEMTALAGEMAVTGGLGAIGKKAVASMGRAAYTKGISKAIEASIARGGLIGSAVNRASTVAKVTRAAAATRAGRVAQAVTGDVAAAAATTAGEAAVSAGISGAMGGPVVRGRLQEISLQDQLSSAVQLGIDPENNRLTWDIESVPSVDQIDMASGTKAFLMMYSERLGRYLGLPKGLFDKASAAAVTFPLAKALRPGLTQAQWTGRLAQNLQRYGNIDGIVGELAEEYANRGLEAVAGELLGEQDRFTQWDEVIPEMDDAIAELITVGLGSPMLRAGTQAVGKAADIVVTTPRDRRDRKQLEELSRDIANIETDPEAAGRARQKLEQTRPATEEEIGQALQAQAVEQAEEAEVSPAVQRVSNALEGAGIRVVPVRGGENDGFADPSAPSTVFLRSDLDTVEERMPIIARQVATHEILHDAKKVMGDESFGDLVSELQATPEGRAVWERSRQQYRDQFETEEEFEAETPEVRVEETAGTLAENQGVLIFGLMENPKLRRQVQRVVGTNRSLLERMVDFVDKAVRTVGSRVGGMQTQEQSAIARLQAEGLFPLRDDATPEGAAANLRAADKVLAYLDSAAAVRQVARAQEIIQAQAALPEMEEAAPVVEEARPVELAEDEVAPEEMAEPAPEDDLTAMPWGDLLGLARSLGLKQMVKRDRVEAFIREQRAPTQEPTPTAEAPAEVEAEAAPAEVAPEVTEVAPEQAAPAEEAREEDLGEGPRFARGRRKAPKFDDVADFSLAPRSPLIENFLDKFYRIEQLVTWSRGVGLDLKGDENPLSLIRRYTGKVDDLHRNLERDYLNKLKALQKKHKFKRSELDRYLLVRHIPEANQRLAARHAEANEYREEADSLTSQVEEAMEAGQVEEVKALEKKQDSLRKQADSIDPGPNALQVKGLTTEAALEETAQYEQMPGLKVAGHIVTKMNNATRKRMLDTGLISQEQFTEWDDAFDYYVPVRQEEADESWSETRGGAGFDVRGPETQMRFGGVSPDKVASPLTFSTVQARQAINRGMKNEIGQKFLDFVKEGHLHETQERELTDEEKVARREPGDKEFFLKIDGKQHSVLIKDPHLARALKGLNPVQMNALNRAAAVLNRKMASLITTFNPEFWITNALRDLQGAGINASALRKKGVDISAKLIAKEAVRHMRAIYRDARGKESLGNDTADIYRRYREAGGRIGIAASVDFRQTQKDIAAFVKENPDRLGPKAAEAFGYVTKGISDLNDVVEQATRVAVFKLATDANISDAQAAEISRDITVDFNRSGYFGPAFNSLYMFWNAGVQGNYRMVRAFVESPAVRNQLMFMAATGAANDYLLSTLADDDEDGNNFYDNLSHWVRSKNLIIPLGFDSEDGEFPHLRVPLPIGYNLPWVLGQQISRLARGVETVGSATANILTDTLHTFSPVPEGPTIPQKLMPTGIRPFYDLYANKNFMGGSIYRNRYPNDYTPNYRMGRENATAGSEYVTENLYKLTDGLADLNPDAVDYIFAQYLGGLGKIVTQTQKTIESREWQDSPFVRRVYGNYNPYGVSANYYPLRDDIREKEAEYEALRKEGKRDESKEYRKKHLRLLRLGESLDKTEEKLREARSDRSKTDDPERRKRIEERMRRAQGAFIKKHDRSKP